MKQILSVIIEIESNNTHSVENIESALNFYWGSNGTFKVTEAAQHRVQRTADELPAVTSLTCRTQKVAAKYSGQAMRNYGTPLAG